MMPRCRPPLLALVLALGALPARAQVPHVIGYQGRLLRADGTAASGTASVTFTVFDAETGGSALWFETQTLGLSDGYYSTFLGLVNAASDALFEGGARFLEVKVGSETLSPRQQVGAVAYAKTAQNVAGGSANVASLKVGGQTVVDSAGRLAGSARYSAGAGIAVDDATQTVSLQNCPAGQILVRADASWQCAPANPGTVTSVAGTAPIAVSGGTSSAEISISQAGLSSSGYLSSGDWSAFNSKYGASTQCAGDLSGYLSAPVVARLQSRPISAASPLNGQVLKWSGAQWEPAADADSGGTVTSLSAQAPLTVWNGTSTPEISIAPAGASADGYLTSSDWTRFEAKYGSATLCGGDLDGTLASPVVARLRGVSVDSAVPGGGQVLRFDGSRWAPASLGIADVGGLSAGYLDLNTDQAVSGAKSFSAAPTFGTPLGVASGGVGTNTAATGEVFAGPAAGSGAPSFRRLVADDIPSLDASKLVSGTLGVPNGGTGAATLPANRILIGNDALPVSALDAGSPGHFLVSGGSSAPSWQAFSHDGTLTGNGTGTPLGVNGTAITSLGTVGIGTWQATPVADAFIASSSTWNAKLASVSHDATLTGDGAGTALSVSGANLTALGTIGTGTWQATPIADAYIASSATWNGKIATVSHNSTLSGDGKTTPLAVAGIPVGARPGSPAAGTIVFNPSSGSLDVYDGSAWHSFFESVLNPAANTFWLPVDNSASDTLAHLTFSTTAATRYDSANYVRGGYSLSPIVNQTTGTDYALSAPPNVVWALTQAVGDFEFEWYYRHTADTNWGTIILSTSLDWANQTAAKYCCMPTGGYSGTFTQPIPTGWVLGMAWNASQLVFNTPAGVVTWAYGGYHTDWKHHVFRRTGTTYEFFVDGVSQGTRSVPALADASPRPLYVFGSPNRGNETTSANSQRAQIDEIRFHQIVPAGSTGTTCKALRNSGATADGAYYVTTGFASTQQVYCDMNTDGGGWTLVAYAPDASTHNIHPMDTGGGTYTIGRAAAASLAAAALAKASTEIAFSRSDTNTYTGNIAGSTTAHKFSLPAAANTNFVNCSQFGGHTGTGAADRGTCTAVTLTPLAGSVASGATRYTFSNSICGSWGGDSYPTGYGATDASTCLFSAVRLGPQYVNSFSGVGNLSSPSGTYFYYGWWDPDASNKTGTAMIWLR